MKTHLNQVTRAAVADLAEDETLVEEAVDSTAVPEIISAEDPPAAEDLADVNEWAETEALDLVSAAVSTEARDRVVDLVDAIE